MQLQLSCPLGDSRLVPSRPRPFSLVPAGGRCDAMRCDGMGMGAASCNQVRPGKRRSISRVFPRVSPTPNSISTTGRTRPPSVSPGTRPYSPAPSRVAVKGFVSRLSPNSGTHVHPSHTRCNTVWRAWPCPAATPKRPACLPTYTTCLACVR